MSLTSRLTSLLRFAARSRTVRRAARDLGREAVRRVQDARSPAGSAPADRAPRGDAARGPEGEAILADRRGRAPLAITYEPRADGAADPGEVVWAWVHYEEDLGQGKDRPVLVLAEEDASAGGADGSGTVLVALMLTSRDRAPAGGRTRDEHGATWVDVGTGDWDSRGRPSEVRADRLLRLDPAGVRREGGRLDRAGFARVRDVVQELLGA